MEDNGKYEFDCPQYVDFSSLGDGDENVDEWFDYHDEEDIIPKAFTEKSSKIVDTVESTSQVKVETEIKIKEVLEENHNNNDEETKTDTDVKPDVSIKMKPETDELQEQRTEDRETRPTHTDTEEPVTVKCEKMNGKPETPKRKPSTPAKTLRRSMRKRKPSNLVTSWDHVKKPVTVSHPGSQPITSKLNKPVNPNLKSTEELEMEKIAEAKKALEESRQMSQQSLQMVRASRNYTPGRSTQPPTKPKEFHFQTDDRIKATKEMEEAAKQKKKMRRSEVARKPSIKASLLAEKRMERINQLAKAPVHKDVKTQALKIKEFQEKTPDRFHSKPANEQNKGPCPVKAFKMGLTIPQSPALTTKSRKRPAAVMSTAEKEELELEEIKKYKFKANPVNSKILTRSSANTSMTSSSSKSSKEEEEEKYEFHARPVPQKMLEGVTGVGKFKQLPVTCPKSPAFALKNRIRPKETEVPKEEEVQPVIKSRPVPHIGVPFKPNLDHKTTTPEPFSFETRDKEVLAKKEAKVQEIYRQEQEARIFHAQPLPDQKEQVGIPVRKTKPVTKPEPFNLEGETDGAKLAERWAQQVQRELDEQKKKCSSFRARPANVLYQEPFKPEKPTKPLTDISDFQLNTERRAECREEFEKRRHDMEMARLEEMERKRRLEEEEENQEVARLRQQAVHKAQPIHRFKNVIVQPSDKPLTMAESPKFSDRRRSQKNS